MVAVDLDAGLYRLLGGLGNVHGDGRLGQDNVGDNGVTHNVQLLDQRVASQQVTTCQYQQNTMIATAVRAMSGPPQQLLPCIHWSRQTAVAAQNV